MAIRKPQTYRTAILECECKYGPTSPRTSLLMEQWSKGDDSVRWTCPIHGSQSIIGITTKEGK